jgi:hypothetical protein
MKVLQSISRFAPKDAHRLTKQQVIARLTAFFERFLGLTGLTSLALKPCRERSLRKMTSLRRKAATGRDP